MTLPHHISTVVVGAGHAGLTMSRYLTLAGRDHLVLERRPTLGGSWQDRWDAFRLVTPNWTAALRGQPYDGVDPDGFMTRDEISERVAAYARRVAAPVLLKTGVERLAPKATGGFAVETSAGVVDADEVIVATGAYHGPRTPALASGLPSDVCVLHSHEYRNPAALPPGAVLIVGSGQTGVQLADELERSGRRVFLSVGSNGSAPRRYRGKDLFWWLWHLTAEGERYGVAMPTTESLPDPRMRLMGTPQLSGHHGGQDVDLRAMARDGRVTLLGHVGGIRGTSVSLEAGLSARLAHGEAFFGERLRPLIETFIARAGLDIPPDDRSTDPYDPPERPTLDLKAEEIATVIWATGYGMDYSWIDVPILDEQGIPRQQRGVSAEVPGLYFIGLLWQHSQASATLVGPSFDGAYLAERMGLPADPQPFGIDS